MRNLFYTNSFILSIIVTAITLLSGCNEVKRQPSLADIDIASNDQHKQKVFIKPKSTEEIRKAYADYLNSADIDDKSRINALSRLAEIEFEYSNKLLDEQENSPKKNKQDIEDRLYESRLDKTIQLLSTSLKDYPKAKNNDTLLYQLAKAYAQKGEQQESIDALNTLVEQYPKSPFYAEAQFRIAEDAFSLQDYSTAEYAYTEAIISQDNAVFYEKSLFKRGWSRFKQQFYTDAVDDFLEAVLEHEFDEFEKLDKAEREQFDEYFRAVGLSFSYLGGSESLIEYFKDQPDFIYTYHTYSMVSEIYLKQERFSDAVETHRQFIKHYPDSNNIPYSYLKIIEIWKNSGFTNKVYEAIEDFYVQYNPSSTYWKTQNENSRVNRAIRRSLKEYVVLMTGYYHNLYQQKSNDNIYRKTDTWYKRYLKHYSAYAQKDNIYFLYAELLSQKKNYQQALKYYELAAYDNDLIIHKDAAYASILITDKLHNQQAKSSKETPYLEKHIAYALKYSQNYPADKNTHKLIKHAAELAYHASQYKTTIELIDIAIINKPVDINHYLVSLKADSYFQLNEFSEAESIYTKLIHVKHLDNNTAKQYQDQLALSIYRQGETSLKQGNTPEAISHYSRISKVASSSAIAATGLYDAIALNMQHKQWANAISDIKRFQSLYPSNKHQTDVRKKLSVAYLSSNQGIKAAQEFEKLSGMGNDIAVKSAALWQAAELYEEKNKLPDAIRSYEEYTRKFKKPYAQYFEAMLKLAELNLKVKNPANSIKWHREIVKSDSKALNNVKNERTKFITSNSYLVLANQEKQKFSKLRLSLPLKKSLKKKKTAMQNSVKLYGKASQYQIYEASTEATHSIAKIYRDFSKSLLDSDRPTNLNTEELDQYEILLEDQAFPFEDKAIEFFEINLARVKEGFYNDWIKQSHLQLIEMFPVRYKREPKEDDYVNVIH